MNEEYNVIFISGNTDINEKDFMQYYFPILNEILKSEEKIYFVLSDDNGCCELTQLLLKSNLKDKSVVSIFGCGIDPNIYLDQDFVYVGGFKTLEERDAAMTLLSNKDIHVVLEGKGRAAVEKNILRRVTPKYNYEKYISNDYNLNFWNTLYKKENNPVT